MNSKTFPIIVLSITGIIILFLVFQLPNILPQLPIAGADITILSLIAIFLTGLITGGLTCLAVQGGLLASSIATRTQEELQKKAETAGHSLPILTFLTTKLIAYTILGFLLGLLGSVLDLSVGTRVILQFTVVIFMVGTALNLLQVHPIFRYFALTPPSLITKFIRRRSKSSSLFAPAFLGALTVFIPCGTTQAMMALSIASGSSVFGALILFTFVLGTSPLFFILGYFAAKSGGVLHKNFTRVAAAVIILLALYNLDGVLTLSGSKYTFGNVFKSITLGNSSEEKAQVITDTTVIEINSRGYAPAVLQVKKGETVNITIKNTDGYGCQQAFVIPSINFQQVIPPGSEQKVTFTAPDTLGDVPFMCSMGMYRGVIKVV